MTVQGAGITGLGANTSLGGAVTACAALRAGLARPAQLTEMAFASQDGPVPVTGHPVSTALGFHAEARLLALALPALRELDRTSALGAIPGVALCVALPDLEARAQAADAVVPPRLRLLDRMVQDSGLTIAPEARFAFSAGAPGFALAVGAALDLLAQARATACIVGGVDTLCDQLAVEALAAADRLKTGDDPAGVQPGEAAAFLLLEPHVAARRRKASVLGQIAGAAVAKDPRAPDATPVGQGLFAAIQQLSASSGPFPPGDTWFVLDRNGETERARDWGYCQQRLADRMKGLLPAAEWDPAVSFGDTGAASAALAAQAAVRGFVRGYAPGRCAVVLSSSELGTRAAVRLERGR